MRDLTGHGQGHPNTHSITFNGLVFPQNHSQQWTVYEDFRFSHQ